MDAGCQQQLARPNGMGEDEWQTGIISYLGEGKHQIMALGGISWHGKACMGKALVGINKALGI